MPENDGIEEHEQPCDGSAAKDAAHRDVAEAVIGLARAPICQTCKSTYLVSAGMVFLTVSLLRGSAFYTRN